MKHVCFTLLLAMTACGAAAPPRDDRTFSAQGRALDGDTLAVDFRLKGVDAFERKQLCQRADGCWQCGKAAQDKAATALRKKTATIHLTTSTTYGRPVATVAVDGQDLGLLMIEAGLAIPETRYLRDDPERAARYESAFDRAKAAGAGALSGTWLKPADWRHGARLTCER